MTSDQSQTAVAVGTEPICAIGHRWSDATTHLSVQVHFSLTVKGENLRLVKRMYQIRLNLLHCSQRFQRTQNFSPLPFKKVFGGKWCISSDSLTTPTQSCVYTSLVSPVLITQRGFLPCGRNQRGVSKLILLLYYQNINFCIVVQNIVNCVLTW